jgi:Fe2+ transport system protein FeoA
VQTLAKVAVGQQVMIIGFGRLAPSHRQHLQAYGLLPGRTVRVLAQKPVTIVLVEHTELAFESEISSQVLVEAVTPTV